MSRLDSGLWGPGATLPDEPPIEEEREWGPQQAYPRDGVMRGVWDDARQKTWERAKRLLKPTGDDKCE